MPMMEGAMDGVFTKFVFVPRSGLARGILVSSGTLLDRSSESRSKLDQSSVD